MKKSKKIKSDVLGSYTGMADDGDKPTQDADDGDKPTQDADDL